MKENQNIFDSSGKLKFDIKQEIRDEIMQPLQAIMSSADHLILKCELDNISKEDVVEISSRIIEYTKAISIMVENKINETLELIENEK